MRAPTITAAVRAYNAEAHIGETVAAILAQTRAPDEVLVVDDGSSDGTRAELAKFGSAIRVVSQPNGGYAAAFNRSFEEARGDFVANCDADDVWEPGKLARQAEVLEGNPEVDLAFGAARLFGLAAGPFNSFAEAGPLDSRTFGPSLYRANPICTSSTLVRRRLFDEVGRFRDSAAPSEDYDFWLRALLAGATFFYDPQPLVRYRVHSRQVSSDLARMHEAEYRAHRSHAELAGSSRAADQVLARDLANVAHVLLVGGDERAARAAYSAALRHRRSLRTLTWLAVLSTPAACRRALIGGLASVKRASAAATGRQTTSDLPA